MPINTPSPTLPFYRTPPVPRPVDPDWKCHQSGDCCTQPSEVLMTHEERQLIMREMPQGIRTEWRAVNDKMAALKAHPCPFFIFNSCVIYSIRPYNCRRFACMRPDPKTEKWEGQEVSERAPTGCKNADDRFFTSRVARRMLVQIQRKASRWGLKHGWV